MIPMARAARALGAVLLVTIAALGPLAGAEPAGADVMPTVTPAAPTGRPSANILVHIDGWKPGSRRHDRDLRERCSAHAPRTATWCRVSR